MVELVTDHGFPPDSPSAIYTADTPDTAVDSPDQELLSFLLLGVRFNAEVEPHNYGTATSPRLSSATALSTSSFTQSFSDC